MSDQDGDESKPSIHPRRRRRGSRGRGGKGKQQVQQHMDAMQQAHDADDHSAFRASLFKALSAHNALRTQAIPSGGQSITDHDGNEGY